MLELPVAMFVVNSYVSQAELEGQFGYHELLLENLTGMLQQVTWMLANNPLVDWNISYPADWFEAVKERFAPQWVLQRWPVRYKTHHVDARELATKLKLPKQFGPVVYMTVSDSERLGRPINEGDK